MTDLKLAADGILGTMPADPMADTIPTIDALLNIDAPGVNGDFSFLGASMNTADEPLQDATLTNTSWGDYDTRSIRIGESDEATAEVTTPTADTPPATPPADTAAPPATPPTQEAAPALTPEIQARLTAYDNLVSSMQTNPVATMQAWINSLPPSERAALSQSVAVHAPVDNFNPNDPNFDREGLTDVEAAIVNRWDRLEAIPEIMRENGELKSHVETRLQSFIPHVAEANVAAEKALAKVDAICEALGLELADPSVDALVEALKDGKTTYRDGVRKSVKYSESVAAYKQARAPRPRTPGNSSRGSAAVKPGMSMWEIAQMESGRK